MDLRPFGDVPGSGKLVLRSFRAVKAAGVFVWDLYLLDELDGESLELPDWLDTWREPAAAAIAGRPAVSVRQSLDDAVYVSATSALAGATEGAPPESHVWLTNTPGQLRWVKLDAKDGRASIVWCVRVEGGAQLGTPIARAWLAPAALTVRGAQLGLGLDKPASATPADKLPPEPDDEGREHDDENRDVIPLRPRGRSSKRKE